MEKTPVNKTRKTFLLFVSFVLLLAFIGVAYIVISGGDPVETLNKSIKRAYGPSSVFREYVKEKKDLSKYEVNLEELQSIYSPDFKYWDEWNWQEKMIQAQVLSTDVAKKEVTIKILFPEKTDLSNKEIKAKIDCPRDSTIMVSNFNPTNIVLDGGFDFIEKLKTDSTIHAYCMNEECSVIGKRCVVSEL